MAPDTVYLTLRVPRELRERLAVVAREQRRSSNAMALVILEAALSEEAESE
jgi:predicted HicB family RNase H-like nuclease